MEFVLLTVCIYHARLNCFGEKTGVGLSRISGKDEGFPTVHASAVLGSVSLNVEIRVQRSFKVRFTYNQLVTAGMCLKTMVLYYPRQ